LETIPGFHSNKYQRMIATEEIKHRRKKMANPRSDAMKKAELMCDQINRFISGLGNISNHLEGECKSMGKAMVLHVSATWTDREGIVYMIHFKGQKCECCVLSYALSCSEIEQIHFKFSVLRQKTTSFNMSMSEQEFLQLRVKLS
jgi:hypothetical protein